MSRMLRRAKDVISVEGTEGRNPFEQLMLFWCLLTLISAFSTPAPDSVLARIPSWMVIGCYILLCIGGSVGLVGVWLRNPILSLLVERSAMLIVGPGALFYAGVVFSQVSHSPRALPTAVPAVLFSLAAFWRMYRVHSYLRKFKTALIEAADK